MWGKHKKLKEWTAAGLMTESQSDAIQSYESARKSSHFGRGLIGLSVFAILVGILSIVASNWHLISGDVKIILHLLLNAALGFGAYRAANAGKAIWREGCALLFFGLTLTLIALIGQVYQLNGELANALIMWMVITLPFMLIFANTYMTVVPWMLAFLFTLATGLIFYTQDWELYWQEILGTALYILLPLAFMVKGTLPVLKTRKPVWAEIFLRTGIVFMVIAASVCAIGMGIDRWPGFSSEDESTILVALDIQRLICLGGFGVIALHAAFHKLYRHDEDMKLGALFAAVSLVVMSLPLFFLHFYNPVAGALMFIAYWVFIGWTGQQRGHMRVITLAIILIAIRIFVIYLELFGTLMDTGIGLIVGGVVMLGLLVLARRLNKNLAGKGIKA